VFVVCAGDIFGDGKGTVTEEVEAFYLAIAEDGDNRVDATGGTVFFSGFAPGGDFFFCF